MLFVSIAKKNNEWILNVLITSTEIVILKHSNRLTAFGDPNVSSQSSECIQYAVCYYAINFDHKRGSKSKKMGKNIGKMIITGMWFSLSSTFSQ